MHTVIKIHHWQQDDLNVGIHKVSVVYRTTTTNHSNSLTWTESILSKVSFYLKTFTSNYFSFLHTHTHTCGKYLCHISVHSPKKYTYMYLIFFIRVCNFFLKYLVLAFSEPDAFVYFSSIFLEMHIAELNGKKMHTGIYTNRETVILPQEDFYMILVQRNRKNEEKKIIKRFLIWKLKCVGGWVSC